MPGCVQDFSEWAQCQVLEFVSQYVPESKDEVYDIMNALDDRLGTPNSAVVLATVKVFLNLTLAMPYDHQQARRPLAPTTPTTATLLSPPSTSRVPPCCRSRLLQIRLYCHPNPTPDAAPRECCHIGVSPRACQAEGESCYLWGVQLLP